MFDELDNKDKMIIELYYGVNSKEVSQTDLSTILNVPLNKRIINTCRELREKYYIIKQDSLFTLDYNLENEVVDKEKTKLIKEIFKVGLTTLDEREKDIICLFYGFDCDKLKQYEIGEKFNISRSYVSVILSGAYKKMKKIIDSYISNQKGYVKK